MPSITCDRPNKLINGSLTFHDSLEALITQLLYNSIIILEHTVFLDHSLRKRYAGKSIFIDRIYLFVIVPRNSNTVWCFWFTSFRNVYSIFHYDNTLPWPIILLILHFILVMYVSFKKCIFCRNKLPQISVASFKILKALFYGKLFKTNLSNKFGKYRLCHHISIKHFLRWIPNQKWCHPRRMTKNFKMSF